MGMFDYVQYEANCVKCGAAMCGFQSKDGECLLELLQPEQVTNFYTFCDKCGEWHDYRYSDGEVKLVDHFSGG